MRTTNILIALIRLFSKGKEGICLPRGSFIAKREEDMHSHSQGKTRYQLITHATCQSANNSLNKKPPKGLSQASFVFDAKTKQTKPNKGGGQKHGWCNAVAKADGEVAR